MLADTSSDTSETPIAPDAVTNDEPAQISQGEWDEVLSFVRELRPMLTQLGDVTEKLKAGGIAGLAAALMTRRSP